MLIAADAIVVNYRGEVLLIQRDDTRTWAPPGGSLEAGELPTKTVIREVEEETGINVQPARLVGMYHRPQWPSSATDKFCQVFSSEIIWQNNFVRLLVDFCYSRFAAWKWVAASGRPPNLPRSAITPPTPCPSPC